ncbi:DUF1365 domain-containing protein [Marinobacter daepoensis]|uniref:DUF1365 domain-containing protein n=1 Tax=Marinobacter daepoensis TaxID=262077 RepID=A0ABS3BBM4_9GAMM|nr:DUF1365 domain-containing protein [Marinobacter daepoensis]MBN7769001.1 DUF1365 domain-containing protein [Marinobacter daepoensis]MBY6032394.1 DUF1365 domain-containing protein [Marinobacter daepoensis]MBY6077691.1 DUF1365 domain-containing protein [Marinobacter daepoensis]
MPSQWLEGTIRHRRKQPVRHEFRYNIGLLAIDLDEWSIVTSASPFFSLERLNWLALYRRDYLDPEVPNLRQAVFNRVKSATGWAPDGPIELITHPRYLGHIFNPVSFYLCYERGCHPESGDIPRAIIVQITNTPWKQRHVYCLECIQPGSASDNVWHTERFAFSKRFHVSPFNGMNQHYRWLFSFRGTDLRIHMNVEEEGHKHFDATLVVQRRGLDRKTLHESLRRFPLETLKGVAGIYWNALKLKLKGTPFHTHPDKLETSERACRRGVEDTGLDVTERPSGKHENDSAGRVSSWRT